MNTKCVHCTVFKFFVMKTHVQGMLTKNRKQCANTGELMTFQSVTFPRKIITATVLINKKLIKSESSVKIISKFEAEVLKGRGLLLQ
jgi:hypothetical protein